MHGHGRSLSVPERVPRACTARVLILGVSRSARARARCITQRVIRGPAVIMCIQGISKVVTLVEIVIVDDGDGVVVVIVIIVVVVVVDDAVAAAAMSRLSNYRSCSDAMTINLVDKRHERDSCCTCRDPSIRNEEVRITIRPVRKLQYSF